MSMNFIYPICSSSKGNCYYIGDHENAILIDAGLSCTALLKQLSFAGLNSSAIKAIFVTHEHSDHVKGLYSISQRLNVPIYSSRLTLESLLASNSAYKNAKLYEIDKTCKDIDSLHIKAFKTPHDCADSQGYKVYFDNGKSFCVCTDLGHMTLDIYNVLKGSTGVLIESNYDENMLITGSYPYFLKQRILSDNGHLSNKVCAKAAFDLLNDGTKNFILGHLSQVNNLPMLAMQETLSELLKSGGVFNKDFSLSVASPKGNGTLIEI